MKISDNGANGGVYHLMALAASALWGTTFISSKILLNTGLSPADIMLYRFVLAYAGIWLFARGPLFARSWRDELLLASMGVTGGSLYFLTENTALLYTQASNVAIIIAVTPLLTALAAHLLDRSEKIGRRLLYGSFISLSGVVLVVLNGNLVLRLNPRGDILTLCAAVLWVLYSLSIARVRHGYSSLFITRKVFFYGIITLLPVYAVQPSGHSMVSLAEPVVMWNLLFLGLVASLGCYLMWNAAVARIGSVKASNYLYVNPVVAAVVASIVLDEIITPMAVGGMLMIMCGVYISERRHGA